ncbi:protein disulfide isomerase [Tribonema minus]|uniref:Protein disulfide isomerase n=1 Tax=Tribonema minus TaxID=303371 RepID=A0A835YGU7_9STRA|nr:protein disulfide isomerase [Tribonema minus]
MRAVSIYPPAAAPYALSPPVCPWCFIGKRRLEAAIRERGLGPKDVQTTWKPFFLDANSPKDSGIPIGVHLRQKYGAQAGARMAASLAAAGEENGIKFKEDRTVQNTIMSHRLVHLAGKQGKQDAVIEALFSGYFEQGAKLSSVDTLVRIAETAGISGDVRAYLESGEDEDVVMREAFDSARRLGITGVPFFVIARDGNKERLTLSGAQPVDVFDEAFDALK